MAEALTKVAAPAYDGSTAAPRKAVGRPRKDPPAYRAPVFREVPPENIAHEIERLAENHMGKERIAVELGTSFKTFQRWLEDDPTLDECFRRGKAKAEHELYMVMVDAALEGGRYNMSVVYALNNRHGWRMERPDDSRGVNVTFINYRPTKPLADFIDAESVQVCK